MFSVIVYFSKSLIDTIFSSPLIWYTFKKKKKKIGTYLNIELNDLILSFIVNIMVNGGTKYSPWMWYGAVSWQGPLTSAGHLPKRSWGARESFLWK